MKAVSKKLLSLMLVAILLVSAVPFQASASEVETAAPVAETEAVVETQAPVVETVAAAEAAEDIVAAAPAADASVTMTKSVVYVHFQLDPTSDSSTVNDYYRVKRVKSELGEKVSVPSGDEALSVLADANGSSSGYEFVRWYYYNGAEEKVTFTKNIILNKDNMQLEDVEDEDYYRLNVFAELKTATSTITLKPNGGNVSKTKHTVELGKTYGEYESLPTPTKKNATFVGWYKADGTLVDNDTVVTTLNALTAKWIQNDYVVVFEGYADPSGEDEEGWAEVGFGSFTVDANSVLKTEYSNFPTTAQTNSMFLSSEMKAEGWYIDGWKYSADDGASWKTFKEGSTKVTGNVTIRPVYKKSITLYACDEGNTTRKLTVTLGERIGTLPNPGTREGYTFIGWYQEASAENLVSLKADLSNSSKHPVYYPGMGDLYAGWDNSVLIYLYIHTDGDTDEHTKLVRYYDAPATGFDLTSIDLADIFASYGKYDDEGDEQYGWYNAAQWDNYCRKKPANEFEYVDADYLASDDIHEFYIMLIDNGNNSASSSSSNSGSNSYNDNNKTVDPSNPSTGDGIFMAVNVMTVSAAALVLVFFLNKKRIVK